MLSFIEGYVKDRDEGELVICVGGLGFSVLVPPELYNVSKGEKVSLWIYTHIYEGGVRLYGFSTKKQRSLFKRIISIPQIGPQVAFSIVSYLGEREFLEVIKNKDVKALCRIPKVGEKTAKRIIMELKESIVEDFEADERLNDVVAALRSLGYRKSEIEDVIKSIDTSGKGTDELLKECLKALGERFAR